MMLTVTQRFCCSCKTLARACVCVWITRCARTRFLNQLFGSTKGIGVAGDTASASFFDQSQLLD